MREGKAISPKEAIKLNNFIVETTFSLYDFVLEEDTGLFLVFEFGRKRRVSKWTINDVLSAINFKFYKSKNSNIKNY